jgi:hypothetical protein
MVCIQHVRCTRPQGDDVLAAAGGLRARVLHDARAELAG